MATHKVSAGANRDRYPDQQYIPTTKHVVIGKGVVGCAVRPSVKCKKIIYTDNTISKLFQSKDKADNEQRIHNCIVRRIDPNYTFTLELTYSCEIAADRLDATIKGQCQLQQSKTLHQLVYIDGGTDLMHAARTISFETIFVSLKTAFFGLVEMHLHKFMHLAIVKRRRVRPMFVLSASRKLESVACALSISVERSDAPSVRCVDQCGARMLPVGK